MVTLKGTGNKLRFNLGLCSNDKKPKEQIINLDRTLGGVPMIRVERNK